MPIISIQKLLAIVNKCFHRGVLKYTGYGKCVISIIFSSVGNDFPVSGKDGFLDSFCFVNRENKIAS